MKLGINFKTGHRWSLSSWASEVLPATGSFTLTGDPNGTGQLVILRRGNIHWMSGPWQNGGEFQNTHLLSSGSDARVYYVSNETEQSFTYVTKSYDSPPALAISADGTLYSEALKLDIHCHSIDDPPGCAEDEFEKLKCREDYIHYPLDYDNNRYTVGGEHVYDESYNLTLYDCQRICWSNCHCRAYTYATIYRVGCKTYHKVTYNPTEADQDQHYGIIIPWRCFEEEEYIVDFVDHHDCNFSRTSVMLFGLQEA